MFLHVLNADTNTIEIDCPKKPRVVIDFKTRSKLNYQYNKKAKRLTIMLLPGQGEADRIVELS